MSYLTTLWGLPIQSPINAFRAKNGVKCLTEFLVVIPDKKPNGWVTLLEFPHHLARLLSDPGVVRTSGTTGKMYPVAPNFNKHQHVDRLQKQGFDGEKIAGQELVLIMGHQMMPTGRGIALRNR